ncbi:hypothetical protein PC123_g6720 [Phytophthora cactorum]|nr:hypothetical protein PC123_g6720 [Phytophthora cactorum]
MKQVTNEPVTCNSGKNIEQRRVFAKALLNDCKGGRCGPYSPMCNPIEGCFSALKTKIKSYLALRHDKMLGVPRGQMKNCACSFSRRQLSIAWLA